MERWHQAFRKSDKEFKELFGVKKEVFHEMLAVVTVAREERLRRGGRKPKLSAGDQLFLTLQYWREYRTMAHLAFDFGVAKSTVSDTIVAVENALIQDKSFHLPGKKALLSKENVGRTMAVDVTESPIERPKKKQKKWYSGKKKRHTIKTQIIADIETQEIFCTAQVEGAVHDFHLFKVSIRSAILWAILLLADSG